jgi:DNA-directed RNA polymerase subunit beta
VKKLKYKKPQNTPEECILKSKTYNVNIYCPIKLLYKKKPILKKLIFIGKLPLMTEKGSFIINGNPRIVISQIIRSPGLYFEKQKKDNSIVSTIIPNKGSWITLKMDKEEKIYVKIDKMRKKIGANLLLISLGITKKKAFYTLQTTKNIKKVLSKNKTPTTFKSLIKLNEAITEKKVSIQNSRIFIKSKFMDENKYDLTTSGRKKINKKLYKRNFWNKQTTLKPEDLLGSINSMLKIKNGKKDTDEVDSLKNKKNQK